MVMSFDTLFLGAVCFGSLVDVHQRDFVNYLMFIILPSLAVLLLPICWVKFQRIGFLLHLCFPSSRPQHFARLRLIAFIYSAGCLLALLVFSVLVGFYLVWSQLLPTHVVVFVLVSWIPGFLPAAVAAILVAHVGSSLYLNAQIQTSDLFEVAFGNRGVMSVSLDECLEKFLRLEKTMRVVAMPTSLLLLPPVAFVLGCGIHVAAAVLMDNDVALKLVGMAVFSAFCLGALIPVANVAEELSLFKSLATQLYMGTIYETDRRIFVRDISAIQAADLEGKKVEADVADADDWRKFSPSLRNVGRGNKQRNMSDGERESLRKFLASLETLEKAVRVFGEPMTMGTVGRLTGLLFTFLMFVAQILLQRSNVYGSKT